MQDGKRAESKEEKTRNQRRRRGIWEGMSWRMKGKKKSRGFGRGVVERMSKKERYEPDLCKYWKKMRKEDEKMPCESQISSAPRFIYLRHFLCGRQFLVSSSIMYVRSLVTLNQEWDLNGSGQITNEQQFPQGWHKYIPIRNYRSGWLLWVHRFVKFLPRLFHPQLQP